VQRSNNFAAKQGALGIRSPPKVAKQGANAPPRFLGYLKVSRSAPQVELVQSLILCLLVSDVLPHLRLVPARSADAVPPSPEVLPDKMALALAVHPRQVDRALALDVPDHLRHRVLPRDLDQHVIGHQVPLFDLARLLRR
jgi:hypothetical protein